jgi:NIPSNAP
MILERRAYTLRPGLASEFWKLQHEWNKPQQIPLYLERNVGYFQSIAGDAEQIIHIQRYDDFADWRQRVAANQSPARADYYVAARKLLTAQENAFFAPSPVAKLSPLWNESRDWTPGEPGFGSAVEGDAIVVVEETIDLFPGALPTFWSHYGEFAQTKDFDASGLIGAFSSITGVLHRVHEYRWFPTLEAAQSHKARLEASAAWRKLRDAAQPLTRRNSAAILIPSPVPWMRALFAR